MADVEAPRVEPRTRASFPCFVNKSRSMLLAWLVLSECASLPKDCAANPGIAAITLAIKTTS